MLDHLKQLPKQKWQLLGNDAFSTIIIGGPDDDTITRFRCSNSDLI